MSPRSPRFPNPASGDDAETGGRHRRPEPVDAWPEPVDAWPELVGARPELVGARPGLVGARAGLVGARPRSLADLAPARAAATADDTGSFRLGRFTDSFIERGFDLPAAEAGTPHTRKPATHHRTSRTGHHRAPGTLPIESWLLIGKTRQQVLLASLVAIALLVVAVPAQQRRHGLDAVDAAAQRAVGVHTAQKTTGTTGKPTTGNGVTPAAEDDDPAPAGSATPAASTASTPAALRTLGQGPAHSLRTTGSQAIALTFDDGPDPVQTPKILALLAQYQLKATFCLVGRNVQKHPEIVREIVAGGHTLCNHTWNHSLTIGKNKPEQIQADLAKTSAAIRAAVPGASIPFFRAPGGNFSDRLVAVAARDGMASLYWQVDPQDWDHRAGETDEAHVTRVVDGVRKYVRPGSIILSHDFNQPDTIEAYAKLLPWLKQNFQIGMPGEPAPSATPTTAPATPGETPASPAPTTSAPTTPAATAPALAPATAPPAQ